ncbi:MAG TPA: hypothetical protein VER03_12340 [Bryobacteraceae bacterium]|nr:hypothetical protein [Bryobacteraceae bacterium]
MFLKNLVLTAALAVASFAADATGVWKAEYETPNGTRTSEFHLKAEGEKLTGKLVTPMGETALKEGTVKGDNVNFSVVRNFQGNEITITYAGAVAGDEMKLKMTFGGGDRTMDIVAKRQK